MGLKNAAMQKMARAHAAMLRVQGEMKCKMRDAHGQATTEYAILVGVLVVVAVLAITLFKPKIEELWSAIAESINGL